MSCSFALESQTECKFLLKPKNFSGLQAPMKKIESLRLGTYGALMITCKLQMSTLSNDVVLYLYKTLMFYIELV